MPFVAYPVESSDQDGEKDGMMICKARPLGEKPAADQTSEEIVLAEMDDFVETKERRKHVRKLGNGGKQKDQSGVRQDRHPVCELAI